MNRPVQSTIYVRDPQVVEASSSGARVAFTVSGGCELALQGLPIRAERRYSDVVGDGSVAMGCGVKGLITVLLVGGIASSAFSQNLYVPVPPPPLPAEPAPPAFEMAPAEPLAFVPLPRTRPKALYPVTDASAAAPAPALQSVSAAEPATTGHAGQPLSSPPSTGQLVRVINNTSVAVATISLIPEKGPAGPRAFVDNLAPFNATSAPLPAGRGCVFTVHGAFADGSPLSVDHLDLCRDPLINITVW